ncbi:MAG: metallophosphoesterase family protein [Oceanicaulis sp.]
MLYYAIGDVHGCADALETLLAKIARHKRTYHGARAHRIVMLGDFVDRGPDGARVLELCMALDGDGHVVLPGNHDQMMHEALAMRSGEAEESARHWWINGAKQTLKSYGATRLSASRPWRAFDAVPQSHRDFLRTLLEARPVFHRDDEDGLFFVHAGVRPQKTLAEHSTAELLWSRDPDFYGDAPVPWVEGLRVVHAHTPGDGPQVRANRVGLDTGAVYGGRLSAGVFQDGSLTDVLSVGGLA